MNFNQSDFHQLLELLKSTDQNERLHNEKIYFEFRKQNYSDNFVQLILSEILTKSDTQQLATVLLRQDIETQAHNSVIFRLSDAVLLDQIVQQLLQLCAAEPSNHLLIQLVGSLAQQVITQKKKFDVIFQFIKQAIENENNLVRAMAAQLLSKLSSMNQKVFPFDMMGLLQKTIQDSDMSVRTHTVQSLKQIVISDHYKGRHQIPYDTISKILITIIQQIVCYLQTYEINQTLLLNQFKSISEIVDFLGEHLYNDFQMLIQLIQDILSINKIDDDVKCQCIFIFQTICQYSSNAKKNLLNVIQQFIYQYIFPNLSLNNDQLQEFVNIEHEYQYENNSVKSYCEDCLDTVSQSLGRVVMNPVLVQKFQDCQSQQYSNSVQIQEAIVGLKFCAEHIGTQLDSKQKQFYSQQLVQIYGVYIQQADVNAYRVTYDVIDCFALLAKHFAPQIQENHKIILNLLLSASNQNKFQKTQKQSIFAVINYIDEMEYQDLLIYQKNLVQLIVKFYDQSNNMQMQTGSLMLLSQCCGYFDDVEIHELIVQYVPKIYQTFSEVVNVLQNGATTFSKHQNDFIKANIECIKEIINRMPHVFENSIVQLMQILLITGQRSLETTDMDIFQSSMQCIKLICQKFTTQANQFLDSLYEILTNCLSRDSIVQSTSIHDEGETKMDPNICAMHTQALVTLSELIDCFPVFFGSKYQQIYDILRNFVTLNDDQQASKLDSMCQLLKAAQYQQFISYQDAHQQIFKYLCKQIKPKEDCIAEFSLDSLGDQMMSMKIYMINFFNSPHSEQLITNEHIVTILNLLEFAQNKIFEEIEDELQNIIEEESFDEDQKADELQLSYENFDLAIDSIGSCYQQLIHFLINTQFNQLLINQIQVFTQNLMQNQIDDEEIKHSCVIETIGIYSDYFLYSNDLDFVCQQYSQISSYFKQSITENLQLISSQTDESDNVDCKKLQIIFYAIKCFISKTLQVKSIDVEILQQSVQFLDYLIKNQSEDGNSLFDNIVSYLVVCGDIMNQDKDFYSQLLAYVSQMKSDEEEINYVLNYFVQKYDKFTQMQVLDSQLNCSIVALFFGKYYITIKNEPSNKTLIEQIINLMHNKGFTDQLEIAKSNFLVQRNLTYFCEQFKQFL